MIASLGMYDFGPAQVAHDRLWAGIRDHLRAAGIAAPQTLTRGDAAYWPAWQSPDLVLSQTCGFPYRAKLWDRVTLIGTLDYGVAGCKAGYYRSVFIARKDDRRRTVGAFDGTALAYNEPLSQSGWAAPQTHAAARGLHFPAGIKTGSHRQSAQAVAEGRADLASLDAVTWALMTKWERFTDALHVVGQTDPTPGLPCIAAPGADAGATFAAIAAAVACLTPQDRDTLHLRGIVQIPAAAYRAVPTPPAPAPAAEQIVPIL